MPRLPIQGFRILAHVTGLIDQELLDRCEYLTAVNQILRNHIPGKLRLGDEERITLAKIGKRLGRKLLKEIACVSGCRLNSGWCKSYMPPATM